MNELILILIPILIADVINPVLFAGTLYGLGSSHPIVNTWVILISFFLSYFAAGIIIAVGMETLSDYLQIPVGFDYFLEVVIALLLFYIAWKTYRTGDPHLEDKLTVPSYMSAWEACVLGLTINVVGLPLAIPYLAAIDQILIASLAVFPSIMVLFIYNIAYIFPFALMILIRKVYKEKSDAIFERMNRWFHWMAGKGLPVIFFLLGLLLLEDYFSYLVGYREYSWISIMSRSS